MGGVIIRRRKLPSGNSVWQLDYGIVDGKRRQHNFPTKLEAEVERDKAADERKKFGDVGFAMTQAKRMEFAEAEARLSAAGVTLLQAVAWALERSTAVRDRRTRAQLRDEFIAERLRTGCRERTVRQYRVSLGSFVRGHELEFADEAKKADVVKWLSGNGWASGTQRNYLADLKGMFRWAMKEHFVAVNPCEGVEPDADDGSDTEISVLSPEEVGRLFETAVFAKGRVFDRSAQTYSEGFVFHELIAYVALGVFCGIRPEEIKASGEKALHLEDRVFVVAGSVAKTGKRRPVDLPLVAVAWLRLWLRLCGNGAPIIPRNFRKAWEALRERAGLKPAGWSTRRAKKFADPRDGDGVAVRNDGAGVVGLDAWPHDVLRHTTATMHYRLHENPSWIKVQLGHVEKEETIHRHYRAVRLRDGQPITKPMARRFWNTRPTALMLALVPGRK